MAQEVVKMKQGMSYSCKEKTIILNVFKYFKTVYPDNCVTEIVRKTSKATGCSEKSVFQFRKEEASKEGLKEPSKTKIRKYMNINSRFIKYDETVRQALRNLIYDLKYRNIVPSLNTLLKHISTDEKLPKFSLMTLRRLLMDMGFSYEKDKILGKTVLVERTDNAHEVKKENLPINNKKIQIQQCNDQQQIQQISNVNINHPPEMKAFLQHTNGEVQTNHMCMPYQSHRALPLPFSQNHHRHHENVNMDTRFVPSNMHHHMHGIPPASIKPPDMNYVHHMPHSHTMTLLQ